jgi:hypothetical protein
MSYVKDSLRSQRIKLRGGRQRTSARTFHLPFLDHVHQFGAAQNDARAVEILEPEHRSGSVFDGSMVLLRDVVQILDLTNLDGHLALGVHRVKRGQIGAAFVDGYSLGRVVLSNCLFEEAPRSSLVPLGSQRKNDGVARLIHSPVKVLPRALDFDICFVNTPDLADRTFVVRKCIFKHWHHLDDPAIHRRMSRPGNAGDCCA